MALTATVPVSGYTADAGVDDLTTIKDIDELGINKNLLIRYQRNQIYVCLFQNYKSTKLFPLLWSFPGSFVF
jgi:hypothetical protein